MSRALMISSDCRAGPPIEEYGEYLDPKYRRDFEGGRAGLWDSDRRVRELEADGVGVRSA